MSHRRRSRFEPVASLPIRDLGLGPTRARELVLRAMWDRAAGPAIARRASIVGVKRGVLELAVEDERWVEMLEPLLPRLAGRLAGLCPEVKIRRLRLGRAPAIPIEPSPPPAATPSARRVPGGAARPTGSWAARLERARDRCLLRRDPG
jgi:hypothetical protein